MKLTPKQFPFLGEFRKVIVSGPQRSGTRVCSQMIANDTGFIFVDEIDFGYDHIYKFNSFIDRPEPMVFHCPAMSHGLEHYSAPENAIIFMIRNTKDIVKSQERIGWTDHPNGKVREMGKYDKTEGIISEIKYEHWENYQKPKIETWFEIDYDSLKDHPMWLPKKKRKDFKWYQTKENERKS